MLQLKSMPTTVISSTNLVMIYRGRAMIVFFTVSFKLSVPGGSVELPVFPSWLA